MLSQFSMAQENRFEKALKKYNNDTTEYIQKEILDFKYSFVGKPLDSLLKNLPAIISYGNEDGPRNMFVSPATVLFFSSSRTVRDKLAEKKFPMSLVIRWMTPLDINELRCLGLKDGGDWTQPVYNHYKNKIIGKIESIDYGPCSCSWPDQHVK